VIKYSILIEAPYVVAGMLAPFFRAEVVPSAQTLMAR
jgi:hypothetical protein